MKAPHQKSVFRRVILPLGVGLLVLTTILLLPAAVAPASEPITATLAAFAPYDPASYGIPYEIASYRILAVMTSENMACVPEGMIRSLIQSSHAGVRDLLANDSDVRVVTETLKQLPGLDGFQFSLEVVGSAPWNAARFLRSIQRWNAGMRNGCLRLNAPMTPHARP